ncbi:sensor domain-containing diguanylate cyclase [Nocardia aurantiaca]|uniref:Diguanylate cyclase n=1 Tax=Nocardia aurantiaca TaxID=2675850 RepID=A0A6I3KYV4_9NOCA|nr:sensor domain-containing diguanylate cyclase [Nocardia aurantiaca]MTE13414.1 diguanylate cyclase [Nocardia aurantiaca]
MEELERAALVALWWRALTNAGGMPMPPPAREVLDTLVDDLAAGVDSERFDDAVGVRAGAALVAAGLLDPAAPATAAAVLYRIAARSPRPDADERADALLGAIAQGHRQAPRQPRTPATGPDGEPEPPWRVPDEMFRIAVENSPIAIAFGDTDGELLYANRAMGELLGVPIETLERITVGEFSHPEDQVEVNAMIFGRLLAARTGTVCMERRLVRADGSVRWASFAVTYVPASGGQDDFGLGVVEDVTERHRLQEQLHWQARHDQLTGLPNRRQLLDRIEKIAATATRGDRIGLCFIDLDRFKQINDHYGHATGDQVLVTVADRLRESLRECDCMIARLGGDEFITLVAPPADDRKVSEVADRLRSALTPPVTVGAHRLPVSASIGVVVSPIAGRAADTLLDAADRALYRAKTSRTQPNPYPDPR